jgi:hypothetical protein
MDASRYCPPFVGHRITIFQGSMSWECTRFDGEYKQGKCTVQLMVTNDLMDVGRARVIDASIASVQARRYVRGDVCICTEALSRALS